MAALGICLHMQYFNTADSTDIILNIRIPHFFTLVILNLNKSIWLPSDVLNAKHTG